MEVAKNNFDFDHIQSIVEVKAYGMERQHFHLFVVCGALIFIFVLFVGLFFVWFNFGFICVLVCFGFWLKKNYSLLFDHHIL